jgi:hypothetical protein
MHEQNSTDTTSIQKHPLLHADWLQQHSHRLLLKSNNANYCLSSAIRALIAMVVFTLKPNIPDRAAGPDRESKNLWLEYSET